VPEFLSEIWLQELDGAVRAATSVSDLAPIVIEQVVVGVPGRGEVRYRFLIDDDGARVVEGIAPERPDVRLSTDYDTAVAIARGEENAQIALARGRLRLGGDIDMLVRRADALSALDDATGALRAATTYPRS
jgi:SCP-2 sterol transfer family